MTKISKKYLLKSAMIIEEYDNIKNCKLYLNDYLEFLEKTNEMLKFKITNISKSNRACETCVSMKKEVMELHETLCKFTKGKENVNLILSSQRPSLIKMD